MKINLASLCNNIVHLDSVSTPSWGTELGQGKSYFIKKEYYEMLNGIILNKIDINKVYSNISDKGSIKYAALFKNCYINNIRIHNPMILFIVEQIKGNHKGRYSLKYNKITDYEINEKIKNFNYNIIYKNENFYSELDEIHGKGSSWFVYEIAYDLKRNELHLKSIKLSDTKYEYKTPYERTTHWKKLLDQLKNNSSYPKNTILYGPPGTGKTYNTIIESAKILDKSVINYSSAAKIFNDNMGDKIEFITFHQNFAYEDFIEGIKPNLKKEGTLLFEKVKGIFKNIAERAKINYNFNYVLIIDEINRANISRVFGELITLIEDEKRWKGDNTGDVKWKLLLPTGDVFEIPDNLYIIGTMNTADKSIALLDVALRRRFTFKAMYPLYHGEKDINYKNVCYSDYLKILNSLIVKEIGDGRGHDLQIGHSYLMKISNNQEFIDTMNDKVIPLLTEYFMNNVDEVKKLIISSFEKEIYSDKFEIIKNSYPIRIQKNIPKIEKKSDEEIINSETETTDE